MTANLPTEFVNKLIKDTLAEKINWKPLADSMSIGEDPITDLLSIDEFHTVHFWESYYCKLKSGYVFLVSEINESGRDGSIAEGYSLYLQTLTERFLVPIMFDTVEVYRLKNAIETKVDISPEVVEFMKSFLEDS